MVDKNYIVNDKSIIMLLDEIVNSLTNQVAFFQECYDIRQFVVGLTERDNPEAINNDGIVFKDSNGNETLFIIGSAIDLGKSIEDISKTLNKFYLSDILKENFSWNTSDKHWRPFTEEERERILAL